MAKEMKKIKGSSADRETAIILEKVYSEIKVIAEGQSSLKDKLEATMGMVAKNTESITMLNIKTSGMKDDLVKITSGMKDELVKINGKLATIEEDINTIKTDFGKRLTHLETIR